MISHKFFHKARRYYSWDGHKEDKGMRNYRRTTRDKERNAMNQAEKHAWG